MFMVNTSKRFLNLFTVFEIKQNCLGSLDGTYIKVNVSAVDQPRYRARKGEIATNVLAVYSPSRVHIHDARVGRVCSRL